MSIDTEGEFKSVFNPRAVNLTRVNTIIDCEIVAAECEYTIRRIDQQIAEDYGDAAWREDALRARSDYDHKQKLALMKKADLEARQQAHRPPEDLFKSRFMKAAQEILPADVYTVIFESARLKEGA